MYAVLSGPSLWDGIQEVFIEFGEEIVYQMVGSDLESDVEFPKIERISVKVLIIDYTAFPDSESLRQSIMNFKILRPSTRIIVLAPGVVPGDSSMSFFFSLGIWDILNQSDGALKEVLLDCLQSSPSLNKGVRWFTGQTQPVSPIANSSSVVKEIEFRDKIIGTVTVAFAGVRSGIGCSFLALQAAFYLGYNYKDKKIALVSFNSFRDFLSLGGLESFSGNSFTYKDIDFFNACDVALLLSRREYDYIVLDIGVLKTRQGNSLVASPFYAEFLRSDIQFLVSGSVPWHVENMLDCLFEDRVAGKCNDSVSWALLFNFSSVDDFRKLGNLDRLSFMVPFFPYLFKYDESFFAFLYDILKPVLPQKSSAKKSFLPFFRSK